MKDRDVKAALRSSLDAEAQRVQARFAAMSTPAAEAVMASRAPPRAGDETGAGADADAGAVLDADGRQQVAALKERYLRVGFDADAAQIIGAGLEALSTMPGSELRRHIRAIAGVREGRPPESDEP